MKKVFLLGAFFNTKKEKKDEMQNLKIFLKNNFNDMEIITPQDIENYKNSLKSLSKKEQNKKMVEYDLKKVINSDLLIANISNKSTGLGIELGISLKENKKIIFIYKKGSRISNMIYGSFPYAEYYKYTSFEDLLKIMKIILNKKGC